MTEVLSVGLQHREEGFLAEVLSVGLNTLQRVDRLLAEVLYVGLNTTQSRWALVRGPLCRSKYNTESR